MVFNVVPYFVPAPRLVCVEQNPGPSRAAPRKRKHIDEFTKGRAVGMRAEGASISKISRELLITRKSVRLNLTKFNDTGRCENRQGGGRKRKLK